jgi:formamidopyrimidine-DNA glycosylase
MIEIPEAFTLSKQINETLKGKTVKRITAGHTTHKFVWYYGNQEEYSQLVENKTIDHATSFGSFVEITLENIKIAVNEGINLRYLEDSASIPSKHQLLLEFTDNTYLCGFVQMYGGVGCFIENTLDNEYYLGAKEKPTPLTKEFDRKHYHNLLNGNDVEKLSAKAFLATKQRIPGLGNGVLQDILYNANIHPKQKMKTISEEQQTKLFDSIKNTLKQMAENNGRDTEKDLFGNPGTYITKLSKNTVGTKCNRCGSMIEKTNYLGGSIYYCSGCQQI